MIDLSTALRNAADTDGPLAPAYQHAGALAAEAETAAKATENATHTQVTPAYPPLVALLATAALAQTGTSLWMVLADNGTEDGAYRWVGTAHNATDAITQSGYPTDTVFQASPFNIDTLFNPNPGHQPTAEQRLAKVHALFDSTYGDPEDNISEATITAQDFNAALNGWDCPSGCGIVTDGDDPRCELHGETPDL